MRRFALLFAVLGLVLAACGGGSGQVVATVEGREITVADVEELSPSGGAMEQQEFNQNLRNAIVEAAVLATAEEEFGITFGDEEIDARHEELRTQIEEDSGTEYDEYIASQNLTDAAIRHIAHQQLVAEAVEEELVADAGDVTEEEIESEYDRQLANRTEACVSHILTETEEEALAARERIVEDGEDFADVAADVSIDPSAAENQGDLGCGPLSQYVPEFATAALDAEIGEVTQPVQSQFGFHLIRVDSREAPELADIRDELTTAVEESRGGRLLQEWLVEVVTTAEVEVDPEFGQWTTEPQPQVLPPE